VSTLAAIDASAWQAQRPGGVSVPFFSKFLQKTTDVRLTGKKRRVELIFVDFVVAKIWQLVLAILSSR